MEEALAGPPLGLVLTISSLLELGGKHGEAEGVFLGKSGWVHTPVASLTGWVTLGKAGSAHFPELRRGLKLPRPPGTRRKAALAPAAEEGQSPQPRRRHSPGPFLLHPMASGCHSDSTAAAAGARPAYSQPPPGSPLLDPCPHLRRMVRAVRP